MRKPRYALLLIAVVALVGCGSGEASEAESAAALAEERRQGLHCLSDSDGHHAGFRDLVEQNLKDPGSMRIDNTNITPVNVSGSHVISMEFGARNAFGATVQSRAMGMVDSKTCGVTLIGIE